jgi:hypothetical protein
MIDVADVRVIVPTRGEVGIGTVYELQRALDAAPGSRPIQYVRGALSSSDTRNRIVTHFLAGEGSALLMCDDDVVPHGTVLELARRLEPGEIDVLGAPVLITSELGPIPFPAVFAFDDEEDWYRILDRPFSQTGLVEVDGIGTGVIAIGRWVLEDTDLRAPFAMEYDENGHMTATDDLAFCRRARHAGYRIFADFDQWADHLPRAVSLNSLALRYAPYITEPHITNGAVLLP